MVWLRRRRAYGFLVTPRYAPLEVFLILVISALIREAL